MLVFFKNLFLLELSASPRHCTAHTGIIYIPTNTLCTDGPSSVVPCYWSF